ncbi:MAG TPA: glycosyltransferase family 4 protein [Sedimentisphaerales bacterium]|nr:glycosyltransferase family 4 protein [Sedimentisphaerales bacterium]
MNVFMLGWEFPPFISGGLGTACYGLTKALGQLGVEVTFVLPKANPGYYAEHLKVLGVKSCSEQLKHVKFRTIGSTLRPYITSGTYENPFSKSGLKTGGHSNPGWALPGQFENYGQDIYTEVYRYAGKAAEIARCEEFDIIHAHDWMTYPGAIAVAKSMGKPLIVQVHSTEFDRSGENVNQKIYDIEREGMHAAAKVIAVSNYTKNIITRHYGVAAEKVEVVYNGIEHTGNAPAQPMVGKNDKVVLFLGRITMQKGPEYFLAAAKKVLEVTKDAKFVMAGDGDMLYRMIEFAAGLGIGHKVLFTRFLRGSDVDKIYQMAQLYVMPSVSEPFGIAPLEALQHNVPVLISKTSGIAEILRHALKVDFWDINEMANKIAAVLRYGPLRDALCQNGRYETYNLRWEESAAKVNRIYRQTLMSA